MGCSLHTILNYLAETLIRNSLFRYEFMKLLQEKIEPGKPVFVKNYHREPIKKEKEKTKPNSPERKTHCVI